MIQKVIHYCWFGGNQKSELIEKCIESWKKYCPEYKIIEWNENNFNINLCEYTSEAYKQKKWAFVSDVARLWIIYNYGGIYLDTDVELKSSLDGILNYSACFASDDIKSINTGLGFAAEKNNDLVYKILEDYYNRKFDLTPCIKLNTNIIFENIANLQKDGKTQMIDNILFIGMHDYGKYAKHYYDFSWGTEEERLRKKKRQKKIKGWKWKLHCKLRPPKLINYADEHRDRIWVKVYLFLVYDVVENGFIYYLKRWFRKYILKK